MIYKGKGGLQYDLSAKPLAAGGEGEIYDILGQPSLVAKIYKPGKTSLDKEKKLVRMVDFPPDKSVLSQIAWPQDVLYNAGQFVGFVMPKMNINEDLNVVYEYGASSKYPDMPWENRLIIAENLCAVLDSVHTAGHTCGDFNPKNISVNPKTGHIMLLDTDSYHIQDGKDTYRCDVGIPEYLPAEVQVKMRGGGTLATAKLPTFSHDTDNFALAIHIFQLLMNGVHPFACAIIPSQSSVTAPQPSDNIIKGEFPFMQNIPGTKIPAYAPKITILPQELQDLFERAFIDGHFNPGTRPKPAEWHKALENLHNELKTCSSVPYHQYYKALSTCPWCDVNNTFAQSFQQKSTLQQKTIGTPSSAPKPSVTLPSSSHTPAPASTGVSSFNDLKQKFMGLHIGLKAAVIATTLITGFFAVSAVIPGGNNLASNLLTRTVDTELENSKTAYQEGVQAMANRNFSQAITEFRKVIERDRNYNTSQTRLGEAITSYKSDVLASISPLEANEAYGDIISRLNTALRLVPADDEIVAKLTHYTDLMHTKNREHVSGRIAEINTSTASSRDYAGAVSALRTLLSQYPAFNMEIDAEITKFTRELVTGRIAEVNTGVAASNDYDGGITALKSLLNEYPAFNTEINAEISRFTTELLRIVDINFDRASVALANGASTTLSVITNPVNLKNLEYTWESSDSSIATVNNNGQVTARGFGSATISLLTADRTVKATCEVSVNAYLGKDIKAYELDRHWSTYMKEYPDSGSFKMAGVSYVNGVTAVYGKIYYNVGGQYTYLSGIFGPVDTKIENPYGLSNGSINIYGDGKLIAELPSIVGNIPKSFSIDITDVSIIYIEILRENMNVASNLHGLANVMVSKSKVSVLPDKPNTVFSDNAYLGSDIRPYQTHGMRSYPDDGSFKMAGVSYVNGVSNSNVQFERAGKAYYNVDDQYAYLSGVYGSVDGTESHWGEGIRNINIYGDGKLLTELRSATRNNPQSFSVDITGVSIIYIEMNARDTANDIGCIHALADVVLKKSQAQGSQNNTSSSQSTTTGQSATIKGNSVRIRSVPDSSNANNILYQANDGLRVTVIDKRQLNPNELWYLVEYQPGERGWVRSDFLVLT